MREVTGQQMQQAAGPSLGGQGGSNPEMEEIVKMLS
jgi:hypothetical protein